MPSIRHNAIFMPLFFLGGFLIGQIDQNVSELSLCGREEIAQQESSSVAISLTPDNKPQKIAKKLRVRYVAGKEIVSI
ncbi:MAG: hypothetical protein ACU836_13495 [Gammaproteobacteria bacterium]